MRAKAEYVRTGRSTIATCSRPKMTKKHGKMVLDKNYIEKLSRRVNRNALRQLIPVKLLQKMVETATKTGKGKENEIVSIRNDCTAVYIENAEKLGMTKNNVLRSVSPHSVKVSFRK